MPVKRTPFSQQIAYLESGALDADATDLLYELVQAVMATHKKGKITLSLELSCDGDTIVKVTSKVESKAPDFDRRKTYLFATSTGELVRDDPEQRPLALSSVDRPTPQNVNTETGEITL